MKPQQQTLWRRIEAFTPDEPGAAFPFSERLARDNGWSTAFARRVVEEYKRFVLLALTAGHPVTPSDAVDQAWHLHLLYTQSYWQQFCRDTLGTPLHHHPTKGGTLERAKFHDWYARTLQSYRELFEEDPPLDIWPAAGRRFGEDIRFVRVNECRHWIIAKPDWWRRLQALGHRALNVMRTRPALSAVPLIIVGGLAGCGATTVASRSSMDGPTFLVVACVAWGVVHGLALWWRWRLCGPGLGEPIARAELDPYSIAYLAGGPVHTLDTALVTLAHRGAATVDADAGNWRRSGDLPSDAPLWERLVYAKLSGEDGNSIGRLREGLEKVLEKLDLDLQSKGLLVSYKNRELARWLPSLLAWTVPALIAVRWVHGLEQHKPVGGLIFLGLLTIGCAIAFANRPRRSRRGKAVLAQLRSMEARPSAWAFAEEGRLTSTSVALTVGLYGLAVLAGTPLEPQRKALENDRQAGGCGGGCGGGGGDGGCGGGCGGCGGCG